MGEFVKNMGEAKNIVGDWGMDKSIHLEENVNNFIGALNFLAEE